MTAKELAENIMKEAGTALHHYMPATREAIIAACAEGIKQVQGELLAACEYALECGRNEEYDDYFTWNKLETKLERAIENAKGGE